MRFISIFYLNMHKHDAIQSVTLENHKNTFTFRNSCKELQTMTYKNAFTEYNFTVYCNMK